VTRLASDELEGRGSGMPGGERAGDFVAEQLKARGVPPGADKGSYFQPFERDGSRFRNVAGLVRGTDPQLRDELIIVGAHYDHCGRLGDRAHGMGNRGEVHHGADDNASGTAGVLAIARAVAEDPLPRSVLFLFFDAEERELWGSKHYCEKPLYPLESTVAMLNLDMIGRSYDGYVFVGGLGTAAAWDDFLTRALKKEGSLLKKAERDRGGRGPSDHQVFHDHKVPVLFFFTNVHRDYHQPRDTPEKIRYKPAAAIARTALEIARILGSSKARLKFERAAGEGLPKDFASRNAANFLRAAAMARRLGGALEPGNDGAPRFADTEPAGSRAGIEKGDVVLAIAGAKKDTWIEVKDVESLRVQVELFAPKDRVRLRLRRAEKTFEIETSIGEVPDWKYGPAKDSGDLPSKP
jgi:peptidase M28-like protein